MSDWGSEGYDWPATCYTCGARESMRNRRRGAYCDRCEGHAAPRVAVEKPLPTVEQRRYPKSRFER